MQEIFIQLNDGAKLSSYRHFASQTPWRAMLSVLMGHFDCNEDDLDCHEVTDDDGSVDVITLHGEVVGRFL